MTSKKRDGYQYEDAAGFAALSLEHYPIGEMEHQDDEPELVEADYPQPGDVFDFAAQQMGDTIRADRRAQGLDPETGLPSKPRRSMRLYGCRKPLQGEASVFDDHDPMLCSESSVYVARDNRAKYGHVCADCWQSLTPEEQALYVDLEKEPAP